MDGNDAGTVPQAIWKGTGMNVYGKGKLHNFTALKL